MPHRSVGDLMARPGIRVHRGTRVEKVSALLAEAAIGAVPVVDDGEYPVGVVSRGDLRRGTTYRPGGFARRGATTAGEVMTTPAVTARARWSVVEAARTMERRRVKQLPVVDDADQLVGFLGRADLLRVFLREDQSVREEITTDVLGGTLGLGPSQVTVTVQDGQVTLQGIVDRRDQLPVVDRLVEGVDGVVCVRNHLAYRTDTPAFSATAR